MEKEKIVKKIKHLLNNTEAISPVVATILILAVAVAAGVGLYFWFTAFQESAQTEVGESTRGQMRTMSIDNAQVTISPFDIPSLEGIDADYDTVADNPAGNGRIRYAGNYTDPISGLGPNGKNNVAWMDERFVVDIPIMISSNIALEDVMLTYGMPIVMNEGAALRSHLWLHLDKDNNYQLLKNDGNPFIGFINVSTDNVFENATHGYTYHFGDSQFAGLDINNYTENIDVDAGIATQGLSPPQISRRPDSLGVMKIYSEGDFHYAFAQNKTGSRFGWVTCDYRSKEDRYFNGEEKLSVFHSPTYKVADRLVPNEAVTVTTYFTYMLGNLDNYNTYNDDGYAEIELPFTITTKEGVTAISSITLTIED